MVAEDVWTPLGEANVVEADGKRCLQVWLVSRRVIVWGLWDAPQDQPTGSLIAGPFDATVNLSQGLEAVGLRGRSGRVAVPTPGNLAVNTLPPIVDVRIKGRSGHFHGLGDPHLAATARSLQFLTRLTLRHRLGPTPS